MTTLPLLLILACGGDDPAAPTGPVPPPKKADAEAAAPPPKASPPVLSLRTDGERCTVQRRTTAAGPDSDVASFDGACPTGVTWVQHPTAARTLLTWGDNSLELAEIDLDAGAVTRLPGVPGAVAAAWLPAVEAPPDEAADAAAAEGEAAEGQGDAAEDAAPAEEAAPAAPLVPERIAAVQLIQTQERFDAEGAYFELDGEQLRFDRQAAMMVDLTVVRVQSFDGKAWTRERTALWPRKEGMPLSQAFPDEMGALGAWHAPDLDQGLTAGEAPDALDKLASAEWHARDADGRAWAHGLEIREDAQARTPVAVEVDGKWKLVEGLEQPGPLSWQVQDGWLLAYDGSQSHLIELATGKVEHGLPGMASFGR